MINNFPIKLYCSESVISTDYLLEETSFFEFAKLFEEPEISRFTIQEFQELSLDLQNKEKDTGMYVAATLSGPNKTIENILTREFITLDLDYIREDISIDYISNIFKDHTHIIHTTMKHALPGKGNRYRVLLFLKEPISNLTFYKEAVKELIHYFKLNDLVGEFTDSAGNKIKKEIDSASWELNRGLFYPKKLKDGPYSWRVNEAEILDLVQFSLNIGNGSTKLINQPYIKPSYEHARECGEGFAGFVNSHISAEELMPYLEEAGIYIQEGDNRWSRPGATGSPGVSLKNGFLMDSHEGSPMVEANGSKRFTPFKMIYHGLNKNVQQWVKENYPILYNEWNKTSVAEDFKLPIEDQKINTETVSSEEEKKVLQFIEEHISYKLPKNIIRLMAQDLAETSPYTNQEPIFFALLMTFLGNIISHRFAVTRKNITSNQLLCIVGPSGAGKSTVLNPFLTYAKEHPLLSKSLANFSAQSARAFFETFEYASRPLWICHEISRYFPGESNKNSPLKGIDTEIYNTFYDQNGLQAYTIARNSYGVCYSPRLSLIGCLVNNNFKTIFTSKILAEGWFRRGLFFFLPNSRLKPSLDLDIFYDSSVEFSKDHKTLLDILVSICIPNKKETLNIAHRNIQVPGARGVITKRETIDYLPFTKISTSKKANNVFNLFQRELEELKAETKSELILVALSTTPEIAIKFALVHCVMKNLALHNISPIQEPEVDILIEGTPKPIPIIERTFIDSFEIDEDDMVFGKDYASHFFAQTILQVVKFESIIESVGQEKSNLLEEFNKETTDYFLANQDKTEVPFRSLNKIRLRLLKKKIGAEDFLVKNNINFKVNFKKGKQQFLILK